MKLAILVFCNIRRVNTKESERKCEGGIKDFEGRQNKLTLLSSLSSEGNSALAT